ncbi:MAG: hypothetical protein AB1393_11970 [Candidatus Edwardsbacteria bacterium]
MKESREVIGLSTILILFTMAGCTIRLPVPIKRKDTSSMRKPEVVWLSDSIKVEKHHLKDDFDCLNKMVGKVFKMQINELRFDVKAKNKEGKPIEGVKITITVKDSTQVPLVYFTGKDGSRSFVLNRSMLMMDPICTIEGGWKYELGADFTGVGEVDTIAKGMTQAFAVSIEDKGVINSQDSLRVYYPTQARAKADTILADLIKQKYLITRKFGLEPILPWGIVLCEESGLLSCSIKNIWPYSLKEKATDEISEFNIHEWTEQTLISAIPALRNDRATRWVADGLAQIALHWWTKEHLSKKEWGEFNSQGITFMKAQLDIGIKKYDLRKWVLKHYKAEEDFTEVKPISKEEKLGYYIVSYFWLKVIEKSSEEIIPKFVNEAQKMEKAKHNDLIKLLSKLACLDIKKMLKVDVAEAINYFEGLQQ